MRTEYFFFSQAFARWLYRRQGHRGRDGRAYRLAAIGAITTLLCQRSTFVCVCVCVCVEREVSGSTECGDDREWICVHQSTDADSAALHRYWTVRVRR